MSLLTYSSLMRFVESGIIDNIEPEQVNAASIDIRLGESLLVEDLSNKHTHIHLSRGGAPRLVPGDWILHPGQFALANTMEVFNLPNDVACEYKLKSSLARAGLDHSLAGWADPGFHNATLTLELHNSLQHHSLVLEPGMRIGQMVFFRGDVVPMDHSYRVKGRYNHQRRATESKGVST